MLLKDYKVESIKINHQLGKLLCRSTIGIIK